jgi:hypothetical protein
VNVLAAAVDVGSMIAAAWLVRPAASRTGLGIWHPAVAWLTLEFVFFGVGAAILSVAENRSDPALYVAAAILVFGLAVAGSERVARARQAPGATQPTTGPGSDRDRAGVDPWRPAAVVGLVVIGLVALVPTLLAVGIPFLAGDITGARTEVGGLDLQLLRVAVPAAVVVAVVRAARAADRRSWTIAGVAIVLAVAGELALASRYLAAELAAAIVLGLGLARHPVPGRTLALVGVVAAALFVGVGILRAYDQAAGREGAFAIERTVNRILLIEPRTLDALQLAIPADQPFFGGLTWVRRIAPWLGRSDVPNLGYWIYPRLFPDQATPGYAAPGLLGEAWANLGWFGVAIFAGLGLLVERLGAVVAMRRRATIDVAAAAVLILFVARTHAVGLDGLIVLVTLLAAWRIVAGPLDGLGRDVGLALRWRT